MANVNAYTGFTPVRHLTGGLVRVNKYAIQSGYATSLYTGDLVILSSGYVNVGSAATTTTNLGIFAGCEFLDASGVPGGRFTPYWPGGTATTGSADVIAWVWDDPNIVYEVQTSADLAYATASHLGGSYDAVLTHAGSTTTGLSGMELNLNEAAATQFIVRGLVDRPGNAVGLNAKVEVVFRKHIFRQN